MIRFQLRFLHHFIVVLLRFLHTRTVSRSRFLHPVPLVHVLPVVRDVVSPRGVIRVRVTCIVFFRTRASQIQNPGIVYAQTTEKARQGMGNNKYTDEFRRERSHYASTKAEGTFS